MDREASEILRKLAEAQSQHISDEKPTVKFIGALRELLASKQCMVLNIKLPAAEQAIKPTGFVGYEDDMFYYFHAGILYKNVYEFFNRQGVTFPISEKTLWKQMEDDGLIQTEERGGRLYRTKQKKIGGSNNPYLWVYKSAVEPDIADSGK